MQITTRSRYSARALLEMARNPRSAPLAIRTIARRQEIPGKYLESLFKQLRIAGLVRSIRGAGGGYVLARSPQEVTLWAIVTAVEEKLSVAECVHDPSACHRSSVCATRDVWDQLERTVSSMLRSVSLANLINMHNEKQAQALSYCI